MDYFALHKKQTRMKRKRSKFIGQITNFIKEKKVVEEKGKEDFDQDVIQLWNWNINGIRTSINREYLLKFLKSHKPLILCLNEIRIDENAMKKSKIKSFIPAEYAQYYNYATAKKGYAGTGILTKVKPLNVIYDIGVEDHSLEGRTLTLEFKKFFLVTSYFPNSQPGLKRLDYRVTQWDKDFWKFIQKLEEKGKPVILCGDLNVSHTEDDITDPHKWYKSPCFTKQERDSFSSFLSQGYVDLFRYFHPYNYKFTSGTCFRTGKQPKAVFATPQGLRIDYFIVNKQIINACLDSEIHDDVLGSDHVPISLEINLSKLKFKSKGGKTLEDCLKEQEEKEKQSKEETKENTETTKTTTTKEKESSLDSELESIILSSYDSQSSPSKSTPKVESIPECSPSPLPGPESDLNTEDLLDILNSASENSKT
ncbi:unnamed protein product [Moneuplotes crassus]|uniref:DNA-(apurinic or apyrimidinic site) endonuclease n=1 Tax=Euplotes crassus TaxID=5936 RepID=A0AAD1XF47_EUPCR|nr:unnamed protein product [Moneuplotes crassus]